MAVYIMFTTLTDEGRKTLKDNPKRLKEVNKEVEAMGVKILAQYALLGPYDFINILEAAGNTTISKLALELGLAVPCRRIPWQQSRSTMSSGNDQTIIMV